MAGRQPDQSAHGAASPGSADRKLLTWPPAAWSAASSPVMFTSAPRRCSSADLFGAQMFTFMTDRDARVRNVRNFYHVAPLQQHCPALLRPCNHSQGEDSSD